MFLKRQLFQQAEYINFKQISFLQYENKAFILTDLEMITRDICICFSILFDKSVLRLLQILSKLATQNPLSFNHFNVFISFTCYLGWRMGSEIQLWDETQPSAKLGLIVFQIISLSLTYTLHQSLLQLLPCAEQETSSFSLNGTCCARNSDFFFLQKLFKVSN